MLLSTSRLVLSAGSSEEVRLHLSRSKIVSIAVTYARSSQSRVETISKTLSHCRSRNVHSEVVCSVLRFTCCARLDLERPFLAAFSVVLLQRKSRPPYGCQNQQEDCVREDADSELVEDAVSSSVGFCFPKKRSRGAGSGVLPNQKSS